MTNKALSDSMRTTGANIHTALKGALAPANTYVYDEHGKIDPVGTKRAFIAASRLFLVAAGIGSAASTPRASASLNMGEVDQYILRAMNGRTEAPLAGIAQGAAVAICVRSGQDSYGHLIKIVDAVRKTAMREGGPWKVVAATKAAQGHTLHMTQLIASVPDAALKTWAEINAAPVAATPPPAAFVAATPVAPNAPAPSPAVPAPVAAANPFDTPARKKK